MFLAAAGSVAAPSGTYSGTASALALSLDLRAGSPANPNGLTAGLSLAEAKSTPFSKARGSGRCDALAPGETLTTLPCTDANTEQVEVTGSGEQNPDPNPFKCQASASPVPAVLSIGAACGNAHARITGPDPFADGRGTVGTITLLGLPALPQPIQGLLGPTPSAVDARIGSTVSRFTSEGNVVKSRADASGGVIVIGGTAADQNAQPDGVIIIEISDAFAEAIWDGSTPVATSNAKAALLTIRVKTAPGTYTTVEPPVPGTSMTVPGTAGTALQTMITAATSTKSASTSGRTGTASASAKAVEILAAQGVGGSAGTACGIANCDGGLVLRLAIADARIDGETPAPIVPELATTGRDAFVAIAGLVALFAAMRLTQSLRRRSNSA
jgi:hypothetical protein